jgi:hypothetical protein
MEEMSVRKYDDMSILRINKIINAKPLYEF